VVKSPDNPEKQNLDKIRFSTPVVIEVLLNNGKVRTRYFGRKRTHPFVPSLATTLGSTRRGKEGKPTKARRGE
jgi:hypothetical protein